MNSDRPGILVVEAHYARLAAEGQSKVVDLLEESLQPLVSEGRVRLHRIRVDSQGDAESYKWLAQFVRFETVVIVGHGSAAGLEVGSEQMLPWSKVGELLEPVQPKGLVAISCFGASSPALVSLFGSIPSLDVVVGSPSPLSALQAMAALLELLLRAYGVELSEGQSKALSIVNAGVTGGMVFTRTRKGFLSSSPSDLVIQDLLAVIGWSILNHGATARPQRRRATKKRVVRRPPRTSTTWGSRKRVSRGRK